MKIKKNGISMELTDDDIKKLSNSLIAENGAMAGGYGFGFKKEDTEGEETYNYGDDEGHDRGELEHLEHEKDMAPKDRIAEIERHLDALKKDMGYDEDHEDRGEEGTDFAEGRTIKIKKNGVSLTLNEYDVKRLSKSLKKK